MHCYALYQAVSGLKKCPSKMWLIMKLTCFFLMAISLEVSATAFGQKVTIVDNQISLKEVFREIRKQTGYNFIYSNKTISQANPVTIHARNADMREVLDQIFDHQPLSYLIEAHIIIVKPKITQPLSSARLTDATVSGVVTDSATGRPLPGVTIKVKGTNTGTVTDAEGRFTLDVPDEAVLEVSYLGYSAKQIPVGAQTVIHISLAATATGLNQLVVVGYGTQQKKDVTGAIASVQAKDFVKGFASDAAQLIRGKVAGLAVVIPDGNPVTTSQVNLRGITTLSGNTQPLVLIDGVPGSLSTVAPENIASIDVLKDGSAAAIYGTRGTNGVILITTKKGSYAQEPSVNLRVDYTTQRVSRKLDFMNPSQYRKLVTEHKPGAIDYGANTDWLDAVMQKPLSQDYNLSLRGGSANTHYIVDLNYRNLNGIIKKSNNVLFYPSIRVNHTMFNGILKFDANVSGYEQHYFSGSDGGSYNSGVYKNALTYNPTDPIKDSAGNWTEHTDKTDYMNPVSLLMETHGKNQNTDLRTSGTITFHPIDAVNIKLLASRDLYNSVRGYAETKKNYSNVRGSRNGYASRGTTRTEEDMMEITATYDKRIKDHHLTGLAGYSWLRNNDQDYWMQNWDFPTDAFSYNNMGAGLALKRGEAPESSTQTENKLIGYFARINYSYKDKYLLAASIRTEGSSKFGADNKFGNFPAISAGWNIAGESFMQDSHLFTVLKLRGGYGITGTEPSDPYRSLKILNFNQFAYINGQWIQTPNLSQNPNPDLRWEKKEEANIGLDFGFLNDRVTGSVDLYKRTTKDLLFNYPVASPPYLYSNIFANAASMENKGIEVNVNARIIDKPGLSWSSSANYSTNRNKLLSLSDKSFQLASGYFDAGNTSEPIQQPTHRVQIGKPIGNFWGFKSVGIDEKGHWIIEGKDGKPKPISAQSADDKQVLGNGLPKTYLSWNNSLSYKDFDLNITMRGAFGFQVLDMSRLFYSAPIMLTRGNLLATAYDKVYGKYPLADDQELQYVSYYIENGNYWKIDNITLGYNLHLESKYIKAIRIYASTSNVKTFTNYKGIDPEVNILGMNPGVDDKYRYPSTVSYTLGLFFTF